VSMAGREKAFVFLLSLGVACCVLGPSWATLERHAGIRVLTNTWITNSNVENDTMETMRETTVMMQSAVYHFRRSNYGIWIGCAGAVVAGVGMLGLWMSLREQVHRITEQSTEC
jgi:hypothetical protein